MCVLLVEDETLILMEMAEALEAAGYEVLTAVDGQQAIQALKDFPGRFTALVTDHRMPGGIAGSYLAERARGLYPAIPVIIATGTPDEIEEPFRSRFRLTVIQKPYQAAMVMRELPQPRR